MSTNSALNLVQQAGKLDLVIGRDEEIRRVVHILSRRTKNIHVLTGEPGVGKAAVVEGLAQRIARGHVPSNLAGVRLIALDLSNLFAVSNLKAVLKEVEEAKGKVIVWGIYFDKTSHAPDDEPMSKCLVAGVHKQEYSARSRMHPPRDHSRCRPPTRSLRPFLLELRRDSGRGREENQNLASTVILFIDEIRLILGGGTNMDASNLLKPMLARGQFSCIGATTIKEYRKNVKEDAAFERGFQQVYVSEPSIPDTISILRGLKERYEGHHGVQIQDRALVVAAQLSARYITGRYLPEKAIDLVDEACANVKENDKASEARIVEVGRELVELTDKLQHLMAKHENEKKRINKIRSLKQKREKFLSELKEARKRCDWVRATDLRCGAIKKVKADIAKLEGNQSDKDFMLTETVGPNQIAEVVSRWTGIPVTRLGHDEKERLIGLPEKLRNRVVGQDEAINAVVASVLRSRVGLGRPQQPNGSFLFLGPTGVARLIGAPPGYVGYANGGQLTEAVRRRPYSVVLFDEVEKAHTDVFNALLQVLDDGRLTDGQGRTVDFKKPIIIMTSNLGAEHLLSGLTGKVTMQVARDRVMEEVKKHFRPELLNRLDEIVAFDPLSQDQLRKVARLQMDGVAARLVEKGVKLTGTDVALDIVLAKSNDPVYGARPIRRCLEKNVVTERSRMLVHQEIDENSTVCIDASPTDDDLVYRVEKNEGHGSAATGQESDLLIQISKGPRGDATRALKKMKIEETVGAEVIVID
ncbi:Chaperone protein ClpB1 [Citrus sinensis]|nr:Chaperone protein ClpB1 [Citrus sinensis]